MADLSEFLPDPEIALSLAPEELAALVLEYFKYLENNRTTIHLRNNLNLPATGKFHGVDIRVKNEMEKALMEAWSWLMREGLIAPKPGADEGWVFITRRGKQIKSKADFEAMQKMAVLPRKLIHSSIVDKVLPNFLRGDYDTAVFQAFRQVEIAVREVGNFAPEDIGVDLMRKAFHHETGPLSDQGLVKAERESMMHLFGGAIGYFKNPVSHRKVSINDPAEAAEMIIMASHLLRLVDWRRNLYSNAPAH